LCLSEIKRLQNAYISWSVFVFFRIILKKNISTIVLFYQTKPCNYGTDGFKSIILKRYHLKAKGYLNLSLMRHCLMLHQKKWALIVEIIEPGKQANSRTINLKGEKQVFVAAVAAERFISKLAVTCGSNQQRGSGGGTWYPPHQACRFLKL
jgi:hypothetical protein